MDNLKEKAFQHEGEPACSCLFYLEKSFNNTLKNAAREN